MIVGFDVDGVIAKAPLRLDKLLRYYSKWWNKLLLNPVGKFLYKKLRRVDKYAKDAICELHDTGHQIVIITYAFAGNKEVIKEWLTKHEVPFDKIIVAKEKESPLEFKIRAVKEEKCDYYIEDQYELVCALTRALPGVEIIHYWDGGSMIVLLHYVLD